MSSLINWEVARGRADELRTAGLRPGRDFPGDRGRQQHHDVFGARALELGEHVLRPLQRHPRGN